MAKTPSSATAAVSFPSEETSSASTETIISKDLPPDSAEEIKQFFTFTGVSSSSPQNYHCKDFFSNLISPLLKADLVQRGHVSCIFSVLPAVTVIFLYLLFKCYNSVSLPFQSFFLFLFFSLLGSVELFQWTSRWRCGSYSWESGDCLC